MGRPAATVNRLLNETSPYLKQHAHNPVDWYPWGPEALAKARQLDRPIFLSIGYSACHWCHVMEHESFENEDIARILNEHFVSIKVDREERPDLDLIYMTAVQMLTGQGGWPLTVFLTPDLKPFYGGTYFPPDDRYGRPGFKRLLLSLAEVWRLRRQDIDHSAAQIAEQLQRSHGGRDQVTCDLHLNLIRNAVAALQRVFDSRHGGFGPAPKFPHPMDLRLLLRAWKRFNDEDALGMVRLTLDHMAGGGIYDHLGGGFARYSTDECWLVPHFEKMLYDNALLSLTYLEAFQASGEPLYREVVEETLGFVLREMTSPEKPFYSSLDADSEGVEGKFYVWSADEVKQVLGKELFELFSYVYDVTPEGNWEGHNILHRAKSYSQNARLLRIEEAELRQRLSGARQKLLEARNRRVRPGRDDKMLTSWNGLMIAALAAAAQVLDNRTYATAAVGAAEFIWQNMRTPDGRLLRTWCSGSAPKLNGYLEDYACLLEAFASLYETTFELRWLDAGTRLAEVMIEQFADTQGSGFFYTGRNHEQLITRVKDVHDNAMPSGNSMAVTALLRLARLTGRKDFEEQAVSILQWLSGLMASHPLAAGQALCALDFHLGPVREYSVVGDPTNEEVQQALRVIYQGYRPNRIVALLPVQEGSSEAEKLIPLLAGKKALGPVTTYICENYTCQTPVVGVQPLRIAAS